MFYQAEALKHAICERLDLQGLHSFIQLVIPEHVQPALLVYILQYSVFICYVSIIIGWP